MGVILLNIAFLSSVLVGVSVGFVAFFEAKYIEFRTGGKSEYFVRKGGESDEE